jgi:hypothetical protein
MRKWRTRESDSRMGQTVITAMASIANADSEVVDLSKELFKRMMRFRERWVGDDPGMIAAGAFYAAYSAKARGNGKNSAEVESLVNRLYGVRSVSGAIATIDKLLEALERDCKRAHVGAAEQKAAADMIYDSISTGVYTHIAAAGEVERSALFAAIRRGKGSEAKLAALGFDRDGQRLERTANNLQNALRLHWDSKHAFDKDMTKKELDWALDFALKERRYAAMLTIANAIGWSEERRNSIKRAQQLEQEREHGIA